MTCKACKRDKPIRARGLCAPCYQRWHKRGTTDYAPKRKRTFCSVEDCGAPVVSHGLCDKHRIRLRDHGSLENPRGDDWGAKESHPLYNRWYYLRRNKGFVKYDPAWDDFLQFISDVGNPPEGKSKLKPVDSNLPIGPSNFEWRLNVTKRRDGETESDYRKRRARSYRKISPDRYSDHEHKKRYGLNKGDYDKMVAGQNNLCLICGKEEDVVIRGKLVRLAVDHCHDTGEVRGLLCRRCNTGLGCFKDDTELMENAIRYLRKD